VNGVNAQKHICLPAGSPTKRASFEDFEKDEEDEDAEKKMGINATIAGRPHRLDKRIVAKYCYNGCLAVATTKVI
jgi:hypothetical protein